jgi:hypothetical protein
MMRLHYFALAVALAASWLSASAQTPAGSTGECKDGTYTSADSKRGACKGHGGVKDWYATNKSGEKGEGKSKAEGASSKTSSAAPVPPPSEAKASPKGEQGMRAEAAPGGGAGKVWVNSSSHVYHCMGDEWYGKTKQGEYMTEADAKAHGAHASHGKACS